MKKKNIILLSAVLVAFIAANARTISNFFVSEPDNVFMLVDSRTRMDLLDYYAAGRKVTADNNISDITSLIKVDSNYMAVKMSESNIVQMGLLNKSKKDTVIIVVNTVELPAKDSSIKFYSTSWDELDGEQNFKEPQIDDFIKIPAGATMSKKDVLNAITFPLISYSLDEDLNLVAYQNMKDFMSKDDYAKIKPYLIDSIEYQYAKGKYKIVK